MKGFLGCLTIVIVFTIAVSVFLAILVNLGPVVTAILVIALPLLFWGDGGVSR